MAIKKRQIANAWSQRRGRLGFAPKFPVCRLKQQFRADHQHTINFNDRNLLCSVEAVKCLKTLGILAFWYDDRFYIEWEHDPTKSRLYCLQRASQRGFG